MLQIKSSVQCNQQRVMLTQISERKGKNDKSQVYGKITVGPAK